ncbi:hypothetical protein PPYR_14214 [Photinus pyralis]|uniref:Ionotropic glutamate receptor C-terminal domain-containing protein n=1 Tax=Photinus pyralis TaxID=7054 RepID=A0A5N4A4K9_PHOPY|nr:hypothetical protein PPYR_14214 [Photinus pyralis]
MFTHTTNKCVQFVSQHLTIQFECRNRSNATMKVTTFALCVSFVSFLSTTSSNISLKDNETSWKACTEKVIQTIFGNDSFYYVFKDSSDLMSFNIRNPRVVIKIGRPTGPIKQVISNNFIIEIGSLYFLQKCIKHFEFVDIWSVDKPFNARVLIITDHVRSVEMIFSLLWSYDIVYVAVLVINKETSSFLFTANPFDVQNNCGRVSNTIHMQSCDDAIIDTIPHPIRNYHGCPMEFSFTPITRYLDKLNRKTFTFNSAVEMLNVSLKLRQNNHGKMSVHDGNLGTSVRGRFYLSHVYSRDIMVWIVPPTNAISALEILVVNFELEVWILVWVVFALFSLAWYVLDKFKTSLGEIVLKTFGITLFGSTTSITQSSRLRFVILCYIIYSVHIQTAYVSNLMRLMASPPTRQPIRNLKELLEANIPICFASSAVEVRHAAEVPGLRTIYRKIMSKNCPRKSYDPRLLLETWSAGPNFSIAIPLKTLHSEVLSLRLRTPNYFIDNHILPPLMLTFAARCTYTIDSLNTVIDPLTERGLYEKLDRDREYYEDSQKRELPQDEEVVALSLGHLNGIFIVYLFGVVLSVMAFAAELIVHRFSK